MKTERPDEVINSMADFLRTPLDAILRRHLEGDSAQNALRLFQSAAANVPAYGKFLAGQGVDPRRIRSFEDFQALPLLDKANYMHAFPLPERCRHGVLARCDRLAVSSGSTGTPTFWPRTVQDELDVALRFEQVFRHSFRAHERDTLAVVCFPMGNWVGGMFTASCCWHLAHKGYPLTVATPGNKPDEILRVVRELGPYFQQTVLLGYPPFVKDVIDAGVAQGVDWRRYRIKFVFAGEVFSEEWRALMLERAESASPCHDAASLYGTADGGVLGNETPLSVAIRRFLSTHPRAARELFGESRLPTLVQYDPMSRFFERVDGKTLAITGDNGVPLIRYHIADRGGVISHGDMLAFLADSGLESLEAYGLPATETIPQPFVWVFGRADFTVSFYGANVYPENVVVGLEQPGLAGWVSGKFVMEVRHGEGGMEFLHIAVELLPNVGADDGKQAVVAASIKNQLLRLNSEFANYVPVPRQVPTVDLLPFGNPDYFPLGVKHRYARKVEKPF